MHAALRALLTGIIDYAGLFPPARLPLDQALRSYLRFRTEPESWMLGRFVFPAVRLEEIGPMLKESCPAGQRVAISCLGRGGSQANEFMAGLRADLELIGSFRDRCGNDANLDVYETRLPAQILSDDAAAMFDLLTETIGLLAEASLTAFFEFPLDQSWRESAAALAEALASLGKARKQRPHGMKIRCGGLEAKDFPSDEQLAGIIHLCCGRGLPLKATAGLHHPMRHRDAALGVTMHGFLNVFGATVLNYANRLGEDEIREILVDGEASNFVFDDAFFRRKEHRASTAQITAARRDFIISFGSCSFDEPREGLERLGLLP
jgi:hypothetical protein